LITCLLVAALLLITSCSFRRQSDPWETKTPAAKRYLAEGNWERVFQVLDDSLLSPAQAERARALAILKDHPDFGSKLLHQLTEQSPAISSASDATHLKRRLLMVERAALAQKSAVDASIQRLMGEVRDANASGRIPFTFADELDELPVLWLEPARVVIFERSIEKLLTGSGSTQLLDKTAGYVKSLPRGSVQEMRLREVLPKLKLTKGQLEGGPIRDLYGEFSEERLKSMIISVYVTTEPSRRLLEEDVKTAIQRRSELVRFVRDQAEASVTVTLRELQYEERQLAERSQTVVVPFGDHDMMVAVLFLPRNASTLFEYSEGGAEIAWAYEILVSKSGNRSDERIVRDSIRRGYSFCSNMRVVNVFGGVSASSHMPNSRVASMCQGTRQAVSASSLRGEVIERLANEVLSAHTLAEIITTPR
jgi:hypothetical protein